MVAYHQLHLICPTRHHDLAIKVLDQACNDVAFLGKVMQPLLVLKQLEHSVLLVQQLISCAYFWEDEVAPFKLRERLSLNILYTLQ